MGSILIVTIYFHGLSGSHRARSFCIYVYTNEYATLCLQYSRFDCPHLGSTRPGSSILRALCKTACTPAAAASCYFQICQASWCLQAKMAPQASSNLHLPVLFDNSIGCNQLHVSLNSNWVEPLHAYRSFPWDGSCQGACPGLFLLFVMKCATIASSMPL